MLRLFHFVHALVLAAYAAAQFQATPAWNPGADSTPTQLSAVRDEEYTTLSHPAFPKHAVRISRVNGLCDTTVG
jgi:hypothetical protein